MNVFQLNYDTRLQYWYNLRQTLQNSNIETQCVEIDKWWQYAPLVTHYLHPHEIESWPGPWELINDNEYCHLARGLGMIYTLLLLGITDIDFCLGKDDNSEDVALVLVDNAKYIMNYWPASVISNKLKDFTIVQKLDLQIIIKKIGNI
jgi:hypothetical protein